jgi:hypothetical protein
VTAAGRVGWNRLEIVDAVAMEGADTKKKGTSVSIMRLSRVEGL